MNVPCPIKLDCPGTDFPITNYSSEGGEPLGPPFISVDPNPPEKPNPGDAFWATGCIGECYSNVSQLEADLCAQTQQLLCDNLNPPPEPPVLPPGSYSPYYSAQKLCTTLCGNGSSFTYVLASGLFVAQTQAMADALANAFACQQAQTHRTCLGPLTTCLCVGTAYSSTIAASNALNGAVINWAVTVGSLPTGLTMNSGVVAGTPTTSGNYTFTVRATYANGNYSDRTYTLDAISLAQDLAPTYALPDAAFGDDYNYQITAIGANTPLTFTLVGGGFPLGVDISSSGKISGPVGEGGLFNPVIRVTDALGCYCEQTFSLNISDAIPVCAYFTCDEVSGDRFDSVSNLKWEYADAPGSGVAWIGSTPGIYSNAIHCYQGIAGSAIPQLYADYTAQLATSGSGFSFAGWFKIISTPGASLVTLTWTVDDGVNDWYVQLRLSATPMMKAADEYGADQNIPFTPTIGDWHFFHIFHNPTDQYVYFQLDNGPATNIATPINIPATTTGTLALFAPTSLGNACEVMFDELALKCDRPFNSGELDYLYNLGDGRTWPL